MFAMYNIYIDITTKIFLIQLDIIYMYTHIIQFK